jgi:hypothetical protein
MSSFRHFINLSIHKELASFNLHSTSYPTTLLPAFRQTFRINTKTKQEAHSLNIYEEVEIFFTQRTEHYSYKHISNWSVFINSELNCWYNDLLRAGRSGDRITVKAKFSAPVQTGPGAHPASCTMGTGFLSGGKAAGARR